MEFVADRFVLTDRTCAIDLATGETVKMIVSANGGHDEQVAWISRCDERYQLAAPSRGQLIDYGFVGASKRFEAWRMRADAPPAPHVERRVEAALAELFEGEQPRPHVMCVFGPRGAGKSALLLRLARIARIHGFVPFAVDLLSSPLAEAVGGRSVALFDDERAAGLRVLADLAIRSAHRHVLIRASIDDACGLPNVRLSRLPGVHFTSRRKTVATRTISKAAERAPVYGATDSSAPIPWPSPGEVAALRRRMHDGVRHLDAGRHAPGERELRQSIGGLTRRGEWPDAAEASLALAASLLKRGRPRDAKAVVDAAREACRKAPGDRLLILAATLSGASLVDLGRLDEAETVLSAAQTVAAHADDRHALAAVALTLSRCRFWRGQYVDAQDPLRLLRDADLDDVTRVRVIAMRARLAVAVDDVAAAVAASAEAVQRAGMSGAAGVIAEAACISAFAHLAAGDLSSMRRDVASCIEASRAARDPLRRMRAQLLLCEQLRRSGARDEAMRLFAPMRRMPAPVLPRLLRVRREMLGDLLLADAQPSEIAARHIAATGFHALALLIPKEARIARLPGSPSTPVDDAIEVLRLCQTASDESATLTLVSERVLHQIHAAAVGFFGIEPGGLARLAARGPRLEPATAQRAIEAGIAITPHRVDDRVEAATPIRYGGRIIGALAARWVIGSAPDAERVAAVSSIAAAAAAPIIAAALAERRRSDAAAPSELLGASDVMADIRQSIARAASAPFAVLIEGESGSGKELVARAIHKGGPRRDRPFVTLNCAALPDDLVESELFGHARGAFTGAIGERAGVFEEAHTGTLFLDEVGELSPRAQAKVLRVVQEGELRRVGENTSRRIDVRIVAATNRDLRAETAAGRFRLDLLYRLDVVRLTMPALRDRRGDIPLLIDHVWREASARYGSRATLSAGVVSALAQYDWPGNVRELQNVLAALVVRVGRRGIVPASALPAMFAESSAIDACRLDQARRAFDENFVKAALVRCGGRRARTAAELGLTRQGLAKLMTRLGIADRAL